MRPWAGTISDEEQRAYNAAGIGRPSGIGNHPALYPHVAPTREVLARLREIGGGGNQRAAA
jgi:hypothetical protein